MTRWALRHRLALLTAAVVLAVAVLGLAVGAGLLGEQSRARENLRAALTALDEYCLSTSEMEVTRDPERAQEVRGLQLKALAIYERVLGQNPGDAEVRWGACGHTTASPTSWPARSIGPMRSSGHSARRTAYWPCWWPPPRRAFGSARNRPTR